MKLWELVSVCRSHRAALERMADSPDWAEYLHWWRDWTTLVDSQQRDKLDAHVPDDLARHVLAANPNRYRIVDGSAYWAREPTDQPTLSALDMYNRFGGSLIEEVQERGSADVPDSTT